MESNIIPTVHEILEHRKEWRLCWHEPMPAFCEELYTADRIVSMMVHDAIAAQRAVAREIRGDNHGIDDYRLLQDFMATNYAWVVKNRGDHEGCR